MRNARVIVYTAIFDDYDVLLNPKVKPGNVDFKCFSNTPETVPSVWETIPTNKGNKSAKLKSGEIKCRPHHHFQDYDYSLWVDGNIEIKKDVNEFLEEYLSDADVAVPRHPRRNCIYDEAEVCIEKGLINEDKARTQMRRYQDAEFPKEFGLSETRVLARRHNLDSVKTAMEIWWKQYMQGAERDQLSFEFAMWETGLEYNQIDLEYHSGSEWFEIHPHKMEGEIGEIWGKLLQKRQDASGIQRYIYRGSARSCRAIGNMMEKHKEDGLIELAKAIPTNIVRKFS